MTLHNLILTFVKSLMADNADIKKRSWYPAGGTCCRALHIKHILVLHHLNMCNKAGGRLGEARS